jgi:hypothetical protein
MKKCGFFRMVADEHGKPTPTYTEGFSDTFNDEAGNEMMFCFHSNEYAKNKKTWTVTEKSTGLLICQGLPTRQAAADELTSKYINRIFPLLQNKNYEEYKRRIAVAYDDKKFNAGEVVL